MAIRVFAPAKINLALHVTGRRADGYHLLDSLVAFADCGDWITVEPASSLTLSLIGPQSIHLSAADNLVLRAARILDPAGTAHITLDKHLPVASGLGGGSADAAATLHALSRLWDKPLPPPAEILALGADLPVCLQGQSARMQGVGETITPCPLPATPAVLVNPGIALATAEVFRALEQRQNPAMPPSIALTDPASLATWLQSTRNDLQPPAIARVPQIARVLADLQAQDACRLARMSGSGATCFALFDTAQQADAAAQALRRSQPAWWVQSTILT
jgi:4-diphosphocytidyl-2-C-methyl-D-erythritol kinase